jgi:hypothetical protein
VSERTILEWKRKMRMGVSSLVSDGGTFRIGELSGRRFFLTAQFSVYKRNERELTEVAQIIQDVLDGVPTEQVVTRELLDGLIKKTADSWIVNEFNSGIAFEWKVGMEKLRDALLADLEGATK